MNRCIFLVVSFWADVLQVFIQRLGISRTYQEADGGPNWVPSMLLLARANTCSPESVPCCDLELFSNIYDPLSEINDFVVLSMQSICATSRVCIDMTLQKDGKCYPKNAANAGLPGKKSCAFQDNLIHLKMRISRKAVVLVLDSRWVLSKETDLFQNSILTWRNADAIATVQGSFVVISKEASLVCLLYVNLRCLEKECSFFQRALFHVKDAFLPWTFCNRLIHQWRVSGRL